MIPAWVVPLLRCPVCRDGMLDQGAEVVRCSSCERTYPCEPVARLVPADAPLFLPHRVGTRERIEGRLAQFEASGWIGDAMIREVAPGAAVLSVGEGCGEMLVRLATSFPRLNFVGVDISRDRVEIATALKEQRSLDNAWFCVADATCLPFAPGAFEVGYIRGVLHVLPSPEAALGELRRVLRTRLLVDRLANRPFFALWSWLLQQYENVRAAFQHRPSDRGIWQSVVETLQTGTYWPLWRYRVWFRQDRSARILATTLLIWERPRHIPVLGWLGIAGSIDVQL